MIDLTHPQRLIVEAEFAEPPAARFVSAYQAAQQIAVAVVAAAPRRARGRTDVWLLLLAAAAPELAEWAYFAAYAPLPPRSAPPASGSRPTWSARPDSSSPRPRAGCAGASGRWPRRRSDEWFRASPGGLRILLPSTAPRIRPNWWQRPPPMAWTRSPSPTVVASTARSGSQRPALQAGIAPIVGVDPAVRPEGWQSVRRPTAARGGQLRDERLPRAVVLATSRAGWARGSPDHRRPAER